MARPRIRPQERTRSVTVQMTPGTSQALQRLAASFELPSWRSLLTHIADGKLLVTAVKPLSTPTPGSIEDGTTLRVSQVETLLDLCRTHGADLRRKPSISALLYAIAAGELTLSRPLPDPSRPLPDL